MEEKVLMVMGEVDIGIIPAPIPTILQVILVYFWVFLFIVMRDVDISLRPANFLYIPMVDYNFPSQGPLNKIFQEGQKKNPSKHIKAVFLIYIKIILIVLI